MTQLSHHDARHVFALGGWLCACLWLAACEKPTLWLGTRLGSPPGDRSLDAGVAPPPATAAAHGSTPSAGAAQARAGSASTLAGQTGVTQPPQSAAGVSGSTGLAGRSAVAAGSGGAHDADELDAGSFPPPEPPPMQLPRVQGTCPELRASGTYTFGNATRSLAVHIYIAPDARSKPPPGGPLILYWHGFGSDASEVETGLGQAAIDDVMARGGVVAAFNARVCLSCGLPDDLAWYKDDDVVSDQVVACAIEQAHIDTRHIHSMGFSAGALHSLHLALARSSFIASVVSYSGGTADLTPDDAQDKDNRVPTLLSFGSPELDNVGMNFNEASLAWYETYHALGWYMLLCDHGGGHTIPSDLAAHAYRFLLDQPYKVAPEPYAKQIPAEFPRYCSDRP